ncbi:hypothetical protein LCGC14_0803330 [marine sediment metagenome]|uniref:DNA-directed DNA polymerase n=1 Tax=marine sediment metagenome TaxID=412755 RepID=A0A0F9SW77_9ZZZZ
MTESKKYPWHDSAWQHVQSMAEQERLPHALLILGQDGLDNDQLAKQIVTSILCLHPSTDFTACGLCHSCQLMSAESHPDHHIVAPEEAGKVIKVDQIRELISKQSLMPKISPAKTVIISQADQMNHNAFNSLLKLLEEPTNNTVLVLIANNSHALPITIKSRCQNLNIRTPDTDTAMQWLSLNQDQFSAEQCDVLLKMTNNSPLSALALGESGLEQYEQIMSGITSLMKVQANPIELTAQWQAFDPMVIMMQLQRLFETKISTLLKSPSTEQSKILRPYWAIVDCILHTMKLLSSKNNANTTLLMEDFMVAVMQQASVIRSHQK